MAAQIEPIETDMEFMDGIRPSEIAAEAKRDMGHTITCEMCGRVAG